VKVKMMTWDLVFLIKHLQLSIYYVTQKFKVFNVNLTILSMLDFVTVMFNEH
jgi:hypothetical protein